MRSFGLLFLIVIVLFSLIFGCETTPTKKEIPPPYEIPGASFNITDWEQDFLKYEGKYNIAQIYYEARNTGTEDIDFFKILIEVTCSDASTYSEWVGDFDLIHGVKLTGSTYIDTVGKKVVSAKVIAAKISEY